MNKERLSKVMDVTLDSALADTPAIGFESFTRGMVLIPTGSSITSLTYYGSTTQNGTYLPLYDSAKNALTQTSLTAARGYDIPAAVYALPWIKIVTDADGAVALALKS